ncbi:MAG TPA: sulfite exporter TauE/SafE family protein [Candidatus Acidoferrum sp.]|nr:sulfite exporter TauE/SafE family protein [Candidatus Acidoferrum sp.]
MNEVLTTIGWIALGLGVGTYGTLIGAGGGFILVPALLFAYPELSATQVTAISLAIVFVNACSGSLSYARMRRIDYRTGIVLAGATVPGAVVGAIVVALIPRRIFAAIMGVALIATSIFLLLRPHGSRSLWLNSRFTVTRSLVDRQQTTYDYQFNLALAAVFSVGIGFLSSLLGIGGGIIQVPLLTSFLGFPAHVATATAQFVLMFTSATGTITHIVQGVYGPFLRLTIELAIGVVIGAQVGAALSRRAGGPVIIRLLAVALGLAGIRLLFSA